MPAPKWEQLADHVRRQINSGELKPGAKLPSTAQLKAEHKVSDSVVRYAMHALRTEGLIESTQGLGVFVKQRS